MTTTLSDLVLVHVLQGRTSYEVRTRVCGQISSKSRGTIDEEVLAHKRRLPHENCSKRRNAESAPFTAGS